MRHYGGMVFSPEQHLQIAAAYEKAASDYMVPPQHRKAFARKAELFRMLARLGAKRKLVEMPQPAGAPVDRPSATTPMASMARHVLAWQHRR